MKLVRAIVILVTSLLLVPVVLAQHGTVTTSGVGTTGVQIESDSSYPDVSVKTGNSTTSGFRVFNSSNTTLLSVNATGDVAVGTSATPPERFYVFKDADARTIAMVENPNSGANASAGFHAQAGPAVVRLQAHGIGRTTTIRYGLTSLAGWSELYTTNGNGLVVGTYNAAPLVLGTSSANRLHITADGKVGLGTANPSTNMNVYAGPTADALIALGADASAAGPGMSIGYAGQSLGRGIGVISVRPDASATAPNPSLRFMTADVQRMIVTADGKIGVGTTSPSSAFDVVGNVAGVGLRAIDPSAINTGFGAGVEFAGKYDVAGNYSTYGMIRGSRQNVPAGDRTGRLSLQTSDNAGALVEVARFSPGSMVVTGNAHFNGIVTGTEIRATYQDVAEWVPSRNDLEPATVVVLDEVLGNGVKPSHRAYDTTVAGVVSARPGIALGEAGVGKEQIATTGRVRVKVDATVAPIRVGDLLVTSDKSGFAMKSIPVDIAGISMHRPGTIVGKALESIESGEGEILVLLSLQ
ncbi:MAG: hypothetical protein ACTHQM_11750 [Thermoanaerobaculia bacterium]